MSNTTTLTPIITRHKIQGAAIGSGSENAPQWRHLIASIFIFLPQ